MMILVDIFILLFVYIVVLRGGMGGLIFRWRLKKY